MSGSGSITDKIERRRIRKAKASLNYAEHERRHLKAISSECARALTGEAVEPLLAIATQYYEQLAFFKSSVQIFPNLETAKSQAFWKRVLQRQKESGTDYVTFITAQFVWFRNAFGKPPELPSLSTEAAVIRAQQYDGKAFTKIVPKARAIDYPKAKQFADADKTVRSLCRVHKLSREELYRKLVLTGLVSFPAEFLQADPAYKRALSE